MFMTLSLQLPDITVMLLYSLGILCPHSLFLTFVVFWCVCLCVSACVAGPAGESSQFGTPARLPLSVPAPISSGLLCLPVPLPYLFASADPCTPLTLQQETQFKVFHTRSMCD